MEAGFSGLGQLLPEGVEFVHNRFKEWLASTYFLSLGSHAELVHRADDDGFDEVCAFAAAAPDQQYFAEQLIQGLLNRGEQESDRATKRRLLIITLKCGMLAPMLSADVRKIVDRVGRRLLPPRTFSEARSLSSLGDLAVPRLTWRESRRAREAACCVRCLAQIDTPKARAALDGYLQDGRVTVIEELSRVLNPLMISAVRSKLFRKSVVEGQEERLPNKLMGRIAGVPRTVGDATTKEVNLSDSNVSDINFAVRTRELRALFLANTPVSDITPLAGLKELKEVDLRNTQIDDLSALRTCESLEVLRLSQTEISSFKGLGDLKSLRILAASHTDVSDLWELIGLPSLLLLDVAHTRITDIFMLRVMERLTNLNVSGTQVGNIDSLASMKAITSLSVARTGIADLAPIGQLAQLQFLDISGTKVVDLAPIASLKNLVSLSLYDTSVADLSPIRDLVNLQYLDIDSTDVESSSVIVGLKNLVYVDISGTTVDAGDISRQLPDVDISTGPGIRGMRGAISRS